MNFFRIKRLAGRRPWFYPLVSLVVALGLILSPMIVPPAVAQLELLRQGIDILRFATLSDRQEVALGQQIDQQLRGREFQEYRGPEINQYVRRVGQRLVATSDRPNIPYTFQVVSAKEVNAFATMGGFVYVTTGLIRTADNEAQLAGVIAHEIGHISSRHVVRQLRRTAIARGIAAAAGVDGSRLVQIGVELAVRRPSSRQNELEADQRGLTNLKRSGYAPGAMVSFLKKLESGRSAPTFLSTHPAISDRIAILGRSIDPSQANAGDGLDNATYQSRIRSLG
jgi:predicted Zn-dependent protease